ncbi:MAG TPA: glycosyltransferase [Terriglobales bacterium]|nr:glycosyltransferase [Terriglobales bacterium]
MTHNPTPEFENNICALITQLEQVIIVDNESSQTSRHFVENIAATYKIETIWSQQNLGIASALNAGIDRAMVTDECRWILMLDQDSQVPPDFVETIANAYEACPFKDKVALIGANYKLAFRPLHKLRAQRDNQTFRDVVTLMTSGTVVKRSVLMDCGRLDESFFMDYVDHDFCLRVRRHGLRIIQANNAILQHQLGTPTLHRLFGKYFTTPNYSPNRRYHNARNRIIVYRRYFYHETSWIVCDCFRWFREALKMILVEHDRNRKLRSIARGVLDGFKAAKWSRYSGASTHN